MLYGPLNEYARLHLFLSQILYHYVAGNIIAYFAL